MEDSLLTTHEAARLLGVSAAFLERDRCYTALIPFVKIGERAVRYKKEDLVEYIQSRVRISTSDTGLRR